MGTDARIALDPVSGMNKYGCKPSPDSMLLAFSSSTASVVSAAGYAAAEALYARLQSGELDAVRAREMQRRKLLSILPEGSAGLVFSASGTDVHRLACLGVAQGVRLCVIAVEESETGSGVADALGSAQLQRVSLRGEDGRVRTAVEVDAEVTRMVGVAVAEGMKVLLIMVDQSKTGLIAPGIDCVLALAKKYQGLAVLVDACQFRLAPETLTAYLNVGFMVAITGSKFFTGPSFSGALLYPFASGRNFADEDEVNLGLLLRWEAALAELSRFMAVPPARVGDIAHAFMTAVGQRLTGDPRFELLDSQRLNRVAFSKVEQWDALPTIFPFLLRRADMRYCARDEVQRIYRQLPLSSGGVRCQLGQPVLCGVRGGVPVSAMRLCLSARHISDVHESGDVSGLIADAMRVLDKAVWLVDLLE